MKRILSFNDFAILEYNKFDYSEYEIINEAIYLDERNKNPHNPDALKKIKSCIFYLCGKYPFFYPMIARLIIRENLNLKYKTMATDGVSIHYDPNFVFSHTDDEIMWVVAHEVLHNTLYHFLRCPSGETMAGIWNTATDYALNQLLTPIDPSSPPEKPKPAAKGSIGKMPEGSLYPGCGHVPYDHEFVNKTSEQIYEILIKNGYKADPPEQLTPPPPPPPPPPLPPVPPSVGDIIYDPANKSYGIVKSVDVNNDEVDYDPIPNDKVKEYLIRKYKGENLLDDEIGKEIDF